MDEEIEKKYAVASGARTLLARSAVGTVFLLETQALFVDVEQSAL